MNRRNGRTAPKAFTLLELLIVLGLIVAVLGLGIPSLRQMYVRSRLNAAVQEIQGELYRTRLEAMKSGKAFVFRCRYGSSQYEILSQDEFDRRENAKIGLGAFAVGGELLGDVPAPEPIAPEPDGVDTRTLANRIVFAGRIPGSEGVWSTPVLFYPNGRTSEAVFALQTTGAYTFRRELFLRGLTGTARIGE